MEGRVLIIEDDEALARMYEQAFTGAGITCLVAHNGVNGILKARDHHPAVILLDIMMPDMDGLAVLDQLKKDSTIANIPVVAFSNLTGGDIVEKSKQHGAVEFLDKSQFKPREIVQKIAAYIEGKS